MQLEPATLAHLARFQALKKSPLSAHEYGLLLVEVVSGRVWAAVDAAGAPLAIGGTLPPADLSTPGRTWLSVVPEVARRLRPALRLMRRRLDEDAAAYPAGVVCVVFDANMAGRRLAALLGFIETERMADRLRGAREWRLPACPELSTRSPADPRA